MNARDLPPAWTHNAVGFDDSKKGRELAMESMFNEYDRHPGRRRIASREAFEVYRTRFFNGLPWGIWILYVRRKRKQKDVDGPKVGGGPWRVERSPEDGAKTGASPPDTSGVRKAISDRAVHPDKAQTTSPIGVVQAAAEGKSVHASPQLGGPTPSPKGESHEGPPIGQSPE